MSVNSHGFTLESFDALMSLWSEFRGGSLTESHYLQVYVSGNLKNI